MKEILKYRIFLKGDTNDLIKIFPEEWNFNFENFIEKHFYGSYFYAITVVFKNIPIGFGNIMIFGSVGWIGNVVVEDKFRNRGIGNKLMELLIARGKKCGVTKFNLFATEMSYKLYQKLGFETIENYIVYDCTKKINCKINGNFMHANRYSVRDILRLDTECTSEVRLEYLNCYMNKAFIAIKNDKVKGYLQFENGDGLIVSENSECGLELLKLKLKLGKIRTVIPEKNIITKEFLESEGFYSVKRIPRMSFGEKYKCQFEKIYSRANGYCG